VSHNFIDLTGKRFGSWYVQHRTALEPGAPPHWTCLCVCGQVRSVSGPNLRNGLTKSCGCEKEARRAEARSFDYRTEHPMYWRWQGIIQRCHHPNVPNYRRYGGRGISVCDRWRFGENGASGFQCFLSDVGEPAFQGASIDRIDNDGNYEPGNVRWADSTQQVRNSSLTKLNEIAVSEIKAKLIARESAKSLAIAYGVSDGTIYSIKAGITWRNVAPAKLNGASVE